MQQATTHISRSIDDKLMEFVVFAIESAAQKTGIPAPVLYNRLEKSISSPATLSRDMMCFILKAGNTLRTH